MNFIKLFRSFYAGFQGLVHATANEQNLRVHFVAGAAAIVAGIVFRIAAWEWVAILFCLGLVISAECMNSGLERLADRVSLERHPLIRQAKDCGAAAVLVLALTAVAVACVIFIPKIWAAMGW